MQVYTNCDSVTLYADGKPVAEKKSTVSGGKVFTFRVTLGDSTKIEAVAGNVRDEATLSFTPDPISAYKLNKKTAGGGNWT